MSTQDERNDQHREQEALFRLTVLGPAISRKLKRGELLQTLKEIAAQTFEDPVTHLPRRIARKTLEEWYYRHRAKGFEGLYPAPRKDRGVMKALREDLRELVLAMKREDPGRSAVIIIRELELAGRLRRGEVSAATVRRFLRRNGLSGPRLELDRPARFRWQAERAGELWQTDAVHGPALLDPLAGKKVRVKVFALLDDRSRLVPFLRAGFHETEQDFLAVLLPAVQRRGIPRGILLDNHMSFRGSEVQLACARLDIRLHYAQPYDGPAKGKIERFWRTLREHVLDRLDRERVETLDELNVRLWAWVETEYNKRPHESLSGRTPLEVWEEDAAEVRWVDDPAVLDRAFTATLERAARNDSTIKFRGRTYEVPTHLRGRTVKIGYGLLFPERLFLLDGTTRVPLREVDPEANARRTRQVATPAPEPPAEKTGLNSVEAILARMLCPPHAPRLPLAPPEPERPHNNNNNNNNNAHNNDHNEEANRDA
jgi:putative transposase